MSVFVNGHCHLDSPATMSAALMELCGITAKPWRGGMSCWPEGDGSTPAKWGIELNDWGGEQVSAELGDHLVITYGRLLALSDAEYQENPGP